MCVERVEQGTQDTALWGSYVQGQIRLLEVKLDLCDVTQTGI